MSIHIPDPQQCHLDALRKAFSDYLDASVEAGTMSEYDAQCEAQEAWTYEPESVVFYGSDRDDYKDEDDFRETVMLVGARDLSAKIEHWTRVLEEINRQCRCADDADCTCGNRI